LSTGVFPEGYSTTQKRHLVVHAIDYQLIAGQLYKLGLDNILRRCVLDHERLDILWECHSGVVGGHIGGKETTQKYYRQDCGGQLYSRMPKTMPEHVMFVSGLVSHHTRMSYHYTLFAHCTPLRSGSWTSSVPLIHQLNTQRPDTSSPQPIT
jgi:hypothetical protein